MGISVLLHRAADYSSITQCADELVFTLIITGRLPWDDAGAAKLDFHHIAFAPH